MRGVIRICRVGDGFPVRDPQTKIRFGTSSNGLPIGVQLVSKWLADSTVLHLAAQLESVSPVRGLRPNI